MNTSRIDILVVDDSPQVRSRIVDMVSSIDHVDVVGEAADMPEAITKVQALRPQVVLLDINMPGGSGISALKLIKRDLPETEVIMLTNHVNPFYRRVCIKAGASFFFDKSNEFERVEDVLRGLGPRAGETATA